MNKIGLIAGTGRLPVLFTQAARSRGWRVVAVGVVPEVDPALASVADKYYAIGAGELARLLSTLQAEGVSQVTMLGKVSKELLFAGAVQLDERCRAVLTSLPDQSDDTIMRALVQELAAAGLTVMDQTALLRDFLPGPGVLTRRQPTDAEWADMRFAFTMAKKIGGLDIGQTVVVKDRAVMAVEAIEGTDACIRRGGALGRGGVIVGKVAKPNQDWRFDMPTVGLNTLAAMVDAGAAGLVIEAHRTLLVDQEQVLALADRHGITIAAMGENT